jgi:hypothetical protein
MEYICKIIQDLIIKSHNIMQMIENEQSKHNNQRLSNGFPDYNVKMI